MGAQRLLEVDLGEAARRLASKHIAPYGPELLGLWFLSLLAYGFSAFNHTLTADDWTTFQMGTGRMDVSLGRWVQTLMGYVFIDSRVAPAFTTYLMLLCVAIGGLIAAHDIKVRTRFGRFIFVALFLFFPCWAEPVTFKLLHPGMGLGVLSGILFGHFALRAFEAVRTGGKAREAVIAIAIGAVFFSLSASSYQSAVTFGALLLLFAVLRRLIDEPASVSTSRTLVALATATVPTMVVGLLFYAAEVAAVLAMAGAELLENPRYAMLPSLVQSYDDFVLSLNNLLAHISQFIFGEQHLFPLSAKIGFWIAAVGFCVIVARSLRALPARQRLWRAALLLILLLSIMLTPWALGAVRVPSGPTYRYNAIVSTALIYAGVFTITIETLRAPLLRSTLQIVSIVLVTLFIFQQNHAALTTYTVNRRDFSVAARIVDRIEMHAAYPAAAQSSTIGMIILGMPRTSMGRPFRVKPAPEPMRTSAIHHGVFEGIHALPMAMNLVKIEAVRFRHVLPHKVTPAQQQALDAMLPDMEPWPHLKSIDFVDKNTVVVKFE